MENEAKKYYLVNYILQPYKGTPIFPMKCKMYEYAASKSPKECYDEIYAEINIGGDDKNEFKRFKCTITDMKQIF